MLNHLIFTNLRLYALEFFSAIYTTIYFAYMVTSVMCKPTNEHLRATWQQERIPRDYTPKHTLTYDIICTGKHKHIYTQIHTMSSSSPSV